MTCPPPATRARALYDFEAGEDNELTMKAGETVTILEEISESWWRGSSSRGTGLIPANFVRKVAGTTQQHTLELTCDLVVRTVAFTLTDLLGVSPDDDYQIAQIRERTARFLQLIFVGAAHWNSRTQQGPGPGKRQA